MLLETTPEQLLEGLTVGTQGSAHCQWCNHEFDESDPIIILFTQPADSDHWAVHRTYCTTCNPSTIAGPILGCTKLLARCRLGTSAELAMQQTELIVLEPKLIDSSEPFESQSALETDEDADPNTGTQSSASSSDGVEIETLPPRLNTDATYRHSATDSSVRSEEQPVPDGGTE
ncbi:hypothetical protein Natoc_1282 [Natronococcus occultus SP4]|uniref:DUF8112 domain-containing protein n=2 Tax=Natronococcus occultus TaxID=29288 RepID=L0JWF5_9EURY|nr:hypothetical protein Natoc_1282 [Natronococcus occultus SP4]